MNMRTSTISHHNNLVFEALGECGAIQACIQKVVEQLQVKTHNLVMFDLPYKHIHLAHVSLEEQVAIPKGPQSCSMPWKLV